MFVAQEGLCKTTDRPFCYLYFPTNIAPHVPRCIMGVKSKNLGK